MHFTILMTAAVLSPIALAQAAIFIPDSSCATCAGLTNSIDDGASNSFWISSFLRGSNGHEYFLVSHVLDQDGSPASYRASVLDITNPSIRAQFWISDTANTSLYSDTGIFNFTTSNFTFGATSETDGLSQMRTWSNYNGVQFDLTFETSSPVLLNGGTGSFEVTGGVGYEWSMPAGKTAGSLTLQGTKVIIDPLHSKTWYDREWGNVPQAWYWFEIHLEPMPAYPTNTILSVWNWADDISGNKNFTTVRNVSGTQSMVPITNFTLIPDSVWTSVHTVDKWAQDFNLVLADGTSLSISSIRDDQELWDEADAAAGGGFKGYMTVTGSYKGIPGARGFAVSEQLPNSYSAFT